MTLSRYGQKPAEFFNQKHHFEPKQKVEQVEP